MSLEAQPVVFLSWLALFELWEVDNLGIVIHSAEGVQTSENMKRAW